MTALLKLLKTHIADAASLQAKDEALSTRATKPNSKFQKNRKRRSGAINFPPAPLEDTRLGKSQQQTSVCLSRTVCKLDSVACAAPLGSRVKVEEIKTR